MQLKRDGNSAYIYFADGVVVNTELIPSVADGVLADVNTLGNILGVEITDIKSFEQATVTPCDDIRDAVLYELLRNLIPEKDTPELLF